MKHIFQILVTAGLLASFFCGCTMNPLTDEAGDGGESGETVEDRFEKYEQIEVYDGEGNLLRTLSTDEELDTFFEALKYEDWDGIEAPEIYPPVEASFVFTQRPTETVLGGKPAEDEREEVIRLTLYEGSDTAQETMVGITLYSVLPADVLETLRGYCAADDP